MTLDYTNPSARLKALIKAGAVKPKPKSNVTTMPVRPQPKKIEKREVKPIDVDLGDILQSVHQHTQETESKELVVGSDVEITSSEALSGLVGKGFKKYNEILDIPLDPADENYTAIMRIQASACEKILSTQTKVDENVLRARSDSRLGNILERLAEAKKLLNITTTF